MKNLSQILNIFILLAVAVTGYIFWQGYQQRHPQEQQTDLSSESTTAQQSRVNKYMQEVQAQLKQQERESATRMQKRIQARLAKPAETDPSKVPIEKQIWKDPDLEKEREQSIDDRISERAKERINEENEQRLEEARLRKEYKQDIIENARRDGYHVEISDSLEIISITPIRKPSGKQDSFESHPSN